MRVRRSRNGRMSCRRHCITGISSWWLTVRLASRVPVLRHPTVRLFALWSQTPRFRGPAVADGRGHPDFSTPPPRSSLVQSELTFVSRSMVESDRRSAPLPILTGHPRRNASELSVADFWSQALAEGGLAVGASGRGSKK